MQPLMPHLKVQSQLFGEILLQLLPVLVIAMPQLQKDSGGTNGSTRGVAAYRVTMEQ